MTKRTEITVDAVVRLLTDRKAMHERKAARLESRDNRLLPVQSAELTLHVALINELCKAIDEIRNRWGYSGEYVPDEDTVPEQPAS